MDHIQKHLFAPPPPRVTKHANQRGELLEYFMSVVNASRIKDGFPPYTHPRMAKKLQGTSLLDLLALRSSMQDLERHGKNAAAYFEWSLNPKNANDRV